MNTDNASHSAPAISYSSVQRRSWRTALSITFVLLSLLAWLLVRLIWLPYYFGLFFFLVAGLLVSAVAFRTARPARPLPTRRILFGVSVVASLVWCASLIWEYRDRAAGVGHYPKFSAARAAAQKSARPIAEVEKAAADRFRQSLRENYPPGGAIGYARWAIASGEMKLDVHGVEDSISISHRGVAWALRGLASIGLLITGMWFGFEALRSPTPVSVFLVPGEEADEEDQ